MPNDPKPTGLKAATHAPSSKTTRAMFHDGAIYEIPSMTPKEHARLMNAPDVGGAIKATMIRRGGKQVESK